MKKVKGFSISIMCIVTMMVIVISCDKDKDEDPVMVPNVDLKAEGISYELAPNGEDCQCSGLVRLTGRVKNIGKDNFSSSNGQQVIYLIKKPLGSTQETILAEVRFNELAAGQELTVTTVIRWDVAIEFQPEFILRIAYDPDILIDGNLNNDDGVSNNNSFTLSGFDINQLFEKLSI